MRRRQNPCSLNDAMEGESQRRGDRRSRRLQPSADGDLSVRHTGGIRPRRPQRPAHHDVARSPASPLSVFAPMGRLSYLDVTNDGDYGGARSAPPSRRSRVASGRRRTGVQGLCHLGSTTVRDRSIRAGRRVGRSVWPPATARSATLDVTALATGRDRSGPRHHRRRQIGGMCTARPEDATRLAATSTTCDRLAAASGRQHRGRPLQLRRGRTGGDLHDRTGIAQPDRALRSSSTLPSATTARPSARRRSTRGRESARVARSRRRSRASGRRPTSAPTSSCRRRRPPAPAPDPVADRRPRGFRPATSARRSSAPRRPKAPVGTTRTYSLSDGGGGPSGRAQASRPQGRDAA